MALARELATEEIRAEVSHIAGRLNLAHAELVAATARLIEDELWAGGGIVSPEHWLVLRAGMSPAGARDITRLARRRAQLPSMAAAMDDGQLSVDQAAVVAKYAPSSHEASIVELALNATVPQLRRTLSRYQFGGAADAGDDAPTESSIGEDGSTSADEADHADPDSRAGGGVPTPVASEPELVGTSAWATAPPELSMSSHDGRFHLVYSSPADVGALVEQAIREATDALFLGGQEHVTLPTAWRRWPTGHCRPSRRRPGPASTASSPRRPGGRPVPG